MEFNVGKVGINLGGGWYGIFLGDKGSLSVYTTTTTTATTTTTTTTNNNNNNSNTKYAFP